MPIISITTVAHGIYPNPLRIVFAVLVNCRSNMAHAHLDAIDGGLLSGEPNHNPMLIVVCVLPVRQEV